MKEIQGLLVKGLGGLYEIEGENGVRYVCRAKGILKKDDGKLLMGDRVLLSVDESGKGETAITGIADRKNALIRPPLSNVTYMLLTVAAASPEPSTVLLDRMTVICEKEGIVPVLLVNKRDLNREGAEALAAVYRRAGYRAFTVSAAKGEGIEEVSLFLQEALRSGEIACFAGASGVGKSTLMNALFPDIARETGALSQKTNRGKHTTRSVELFPVYNGWLADTPGFSLLDFVRFDFVSLDELEGCFPEFAPYLSGCRYTDCTHGTEDGCLILAALASGEIEKSRYESFRELFALLKEKEKSIYDGNKKKI